MTFSNRIRQVAAAALMSAAIVATMIEPAFAQAAGIETVLQNIVDSPPAMNREHSPPRLCRDPQNRLENPPLDRRMRFQLGQAIEADLADIVRLADETFKQRQFVIALMRELGVQPQCRPDPGAIFCERGGLAPCLWRRRHGKYVNSALIRQSHRHLGIWI